MGKITSLYLTDEEAAGLKKFCEEAPLVVLGWSTVCLQTIDFLIVGLIALVCLLSVKKEFTKTAT